MIPEVLVDDALRRARTIARSAAAQAQKETGCHLVAVVAQIEEGRACTSMAVDPSLENDPETEVVLMKCALARVLSLLVLHAGVKEASVAVHAALRQGVDLARLAHEHGDAQAG